MKVSLLLTIVLLFASMKSNAQRATNIAFDLDYSQQQFIINYNISKHKLDEVYQVDISVSFDSGKTYDEAIMKSLKGDVGENIEGGSGKIIYWKVFDDISSEISGDIRFKIDVNPIKVKITKHFYLAASPGYEAWAGAQIGVLGGTGFYLAFRASPNFTTATNYESDENGIINFNEDRFYTLTGSTGKKIMAITAGLIFQASKKLHFNLGAGYGFNQFIREMELSDTSGGNVTTDYSVDQHFNITGIQSEAGIIIEMGKANLNAGYSIFNFTTGIATFGLGVKF